MSVSPTPGERFGPYDIVGPLGSGGMGVVYRARDPRLGRDVAIKTLPPSSLADPARLHRFEQEARAASALNHPNVLAVFDVGREGDTPFLVTELLEGQTLRERIDEGRLPPRKVIELAMHVAQGLAAVHEKGIVHRDLKPDNLFLTHDGQLKILDFGVARTTEGLAPPTGTLPLTQSGAVMGTAGYMAPEQVRGRPADARSDLFALGAIIYECLTGQMAFPGETPVERGYAILNAEPHELDAVQVVAPPALARVMRRCLDKNPEQRFQHARDLVYALEAITDGSGQPPLGAAANPTTTRLAALGMLSMTLVALAFVLRPSPKENVALATPAPESKAAISRRVSFRSGSIYNARFTADGRGLAYTGSFENTPTRVYAGVLDGAQLRPVSEPGTFLFDLSGKDELALAGVMDESASWDGRTLARASLAGGAPRPLYEGVVSADFGTDDSLVLIRFHDARFFIEYPPGNVVVTSNHPVANARLSPDLEYIAFERHPVRGDDRGTVEIVDRVGKPIASSTSAWTLEGLAWAPGSAEVWFSAGYDDVSRQIHSLSIHARQHRVFSAPGSLRLMDIDAKGRLLATNGIMRSRMFGKVNGEAKERSLSWLDGSMPLDVSNDGKVMLFLEGYGPAGSEVQTWLRRFDTPDDTPVLLALGWGRALSPDKRWAIITPTPPFNTLRVIPTGAGEQRDLPAGEFQAITRVRYFADGQRIAFSAIGPDNQSHLYLQSVVQADEETGIAGKPERLTEVPLFLAAPPSPDGKWLVGCGKDKRCMLIDAQSGEEKALRDLAMGDFPLQWTADGKGLWLIRSPKPNSSSVGVELLRYDLVTAKTVHIGALDPPDPVGMHHLKESVLTPDGKHYVYTVNQQLDELFLVEGVR
ncbi:MAG: serine/threonine-protein kinase [Archangium sp.]|nr:serine/threonine-protein kinase [Archangium sp.]MDP3151664.1 serine/threonine-protein kinase [Archangium sp.]MDP3573182.1 serine/threonine-protein kinase [Archangium sp.]